MSNNLLVLQSDFGLVDGAVSAMIGVALQESRDLVVHNLTHDITPYNIFEGSYRLFQTVEYWPEGTTFVSVVDPVVGFLVGFIGHAFKDALQYGSPWWSWVLASGVFGLVLGFAKNRLRVQEGIFEKKDILSFNLFQIIANVVAWGVVAPVLDILVYSEPANKVFAQGLVAGIVNGLTVAIAGTILVAVYTKSQTQTGSLSKD